MKKYLYMIAALFGIDYFCKENIEAQKPEDFPRDVGKSHGKIRLYRNHNDGFCFGVKKKRKNWSAWCRLSLPRRQRAF